MLRRRNASAASKDEAATQGTRSRWNTIAISAFDSPAFTGEDISAAVLRKLVSLEWVETAKRKWGEASPLYQVRVLGEFPTTADDTVCSLADLEAAANRELTPTKPLVVACDVACFRSDETVIVVRRAIAFASRRRSRRRAR